jgi:hypothetical protein
MFEKAEWIYRHALGDEHQVRPYTLSSAFLKCMRDVGHCIGRRDTNYSP